MGELWAQNPHQLMFHHFSVKDGLSSGKIRGFLQDREGFIWIVTQQGLNRFDGNQFRRFYFHPRDTLTLSSNVLKALAEDETGRLWIGTKNAGLVYFDKESESFHRLNVGPLDENLSVNCLLWGKDGTLWIGTQGKELFGYMPSKDSVITYKETANPQTGLSGGGIIDLWESPKGELWIACSKGINIYDPVKDQFTYYFEKGLAEDQERNRYQCILPDDSTTFWLGTHNGITHWDPQNNSYERYYPQGDSLPHIHNIINDLWELNDRFLWVASRKGLLLFDKIEKQFHHLSNNYYNLNNLKDSPYNAIFEDRSGLLWIGGNDGAYTWDRYSLKFYEPYSAKSRPSEIHRRMLFQGDTLWMALENGIYFSTPNLPPKRLIEGNFYSVALGKSGNIYAGPWGNSRLFKIHPQTHLISELPIPWREMQVDSLLTFMDIIRGSRDYLWIATRSSLFRFDEKTQEYFEIPNTSEHLQGFTGENNNDLLYDSRSNLWIVSDRGMFLLTPEEQEKKHADSLYFRHFYYDPRDSSTLPTNEINTLLEDSRGMIWIGSKSGLLTYDPKEEKFSHRKETEALAHGYITCILEDSSGDIWVSTDNLGITRIRPESGETQIYFEEDGLLTDAFNWNSCICTPDKGFIFGSREGLNHFFPDSIGSIVAEKPNIFLTELWVQNNRLRVGDSDSLLQRSLLHTAKITLSHHQRALKLVFSLLDYDSPTQNVYRYILENFDKSWQLAGNKNEATYTNLSPGTYTFRVQGRTSRGEFSAEVEDQLIIRILPPWWWNIYAWIAYVIVGIFLVWLIYKNQLAIKLRQAEAEKVLEIDRIRKQLYTDITHEIRTPLTIINGMNQLLEERYEDSDEIQDHTRVVNYNTQKILNLINQILDLARLEEGGMPLVLKQADIIPYIGYITDSFRSFARSKEISLVFTPETDAVMLDFDADKVLTVLSNLLSNALKFTPKSGWIKVVAKEKKPHTLLISVQDSGVGIDAERIPFVFDRYYQAANSLSSDAGGTGIGLALTQELVHLMGGKIWVKSMVNEGSTFFVELPITLKAAPLEDGDLTPQDNLYHQSLRTSVPAPSFDSEGNNEDLLVLIIEDSADVRFFLRKLLSPIFRVEFAENGKQGIQKAIESVPDIVISDVMMPEASGMDVCEALKKDERTSHIPIILLTARVDQASKIEGLAYGADAYLGKPLDKEELLTRIKKLVELRNTLRKKYQFFPHTTKLSSVSPEDLFLEKVGKVIEASLEDPDLGVDDICKDVGVSRTQLHRKLKVLTGLSTTQMIRKIRLTRARQMLIHSKEAISQIAFGVGFSDPSYFSKMYSEEFKEKPSDTRNSLRKPG